MAGISSTPGATSIDAAHDSSKNYTGPLMVVTMLFFMWGFITCMNDILIPKLKLVFALQDWQAMLIQSAFFTAYFIISLIYFLFSITKGDPIRKIGYKNGIIIGLVVAAIGCALFLPAAEFKNYAFFLGALFVLASGITILQIAANPYVAILGSPETSSSRLNLTQAFNSFGTTVAPGLGGLLIFEATHEAVGAPNADSVKMPYLGLAAALLVIAVLIKLAKLPQISGEGKINADAGALKYSHLVLGIICIFMYVGGEVAIGSSLIGFMKLPKIGGLTELEASKYLSLFWGGAMVGRFIGAVALAKFSNSMNRYLWIAFIAAMAFVGVWIYFSFDLALISLGLVAVNIVVFVVGNFVPSRTLGLFATAVIVLLGIGIAAEGQLALWSIIAIGLFNSIMFPTIFTLAIKGLGVHSSQGSSLLVMAIVGGAIVPPLQGAVSDLTQNLQLSFIVPLICYLYIVFYGFVGYKPKNVSED